MNGSRRPATARNLGDGDIGLWVDYEDRARAKEIPTARWDKNLKCWRIRLELGAEVEDLVRYLNRESPARTPGTDAVALARALAEMFAALPVEMRRPVHRALAHVLHPDKGGDHVAMQALNVAAEKALR